MSDKNKPVKYTLKREKRKTGIVPQKRITSLDINEAENVIKLPRGYAEALSNVAKSDPELSDLESIASFIRTMEDIDSQNKSDGIRIHYMDDSIAEMLLKAEEKIRDSTASTMSLGEKEFQSLINVSRPETIDDFSRCMKKKRKLKEIYEEYINSGSAMISYETMLLDKSHIDKIRDTLYKLEEYCLAFLERYPAYNLKRLEKNIDYLRKKHRMSRNDLELILGVAPSYLSRAFNPTDEKRRVSVDVLWKICSFFDVSMDSILKEDLQSNTITIDNKTIEFMETILKATQERKIKWEPYRESRYITSDASNAVDYLLFDRELSAEDEHIETKVWMNLGEKKTIYFASIACKNDTYYYFGTDGNDSFKWMINTKEKKQQTIKPLCQKLNKLIIDFESAGYVSAEEENLMDQIMEGLK